MADFPALRPSTRLYSPALYPVQVFRAHSGSETRVRRKSIGTGHVLNLSFAALTPADAKSIRDHYVTQQGSFASFNLPSVIWSGITGYATLLENGYRWVYANPPSVADVSCEYQSAQVSLRAVYDYASPGFTPAPYAGALTVTNPAAWWSMSGSAACSLTPAGAGLSRTVSINFTPGVAIVQTAGMTATVSAAVEGGTATGAAEMSGLNATVDIGFITSFVEVEGFNPTVSVSFEPGQAGGDYWADMSVQLYGWEGFGYIEWWGN